MKDQSDIDMTKLVLTVVEAGRLMGCSRNKAYQLAKEGILPTRRIKGRIIVPRDRFLAWLNEDPRDNQSPVN